MNLHQYLLAIQDNKAINLKCFLSLLSAQHQHNWRNIFKKGDKTLSKDTYKLSVIDQQCFKELLEASKPIHNRIEAAINGDSHKQKTSMSYLLVYPNILIQSELSKQLICPKVVVIDGVGLTKAFQTQKKLIIIENQENFFRYQEFLPQLINTSEPLDVTFGQGNSITNSLNAIYFDQYQEVLCCFDYDLGGLTMFSTLTKLTKASVEFIVPTAISLKNEAFVNDHFKKVPEKVVHWQKAIKLAEQLGLNDLAQAFNTSKKFMEQEVYLSNKTFCLKEENR